MKLHLLALIASLFFSPASMAERIDINHADAPTLALHLKGVGQKKANAIVEFRSRHGKFEKPEDLLKVKGIGEKTLSINRDRIHIGPDK